MTQYENNDSEAQKKTGAIKKTIKAVFAVTVSAGLVGTFALPAYSNPSNEATQFSSQAPQKLKTVDAAAAEFIVEALAVGENLEIREREALQEQLALEEEQRIQQERASALTAQSAFGVRNDIPAGSGGSGLAAAALAQLGAGQDCTDLVQNALAAIGVTTRRDQGGYDMGVGDFYGVGSGVSGDWAPGDILIWGTHTAVYIGNGQAVHGGYGGFNTVVASATLDGPPAGVVRVG